MKQILATTLLCALLAAIPATMMWIQHYFVTGLNPFVFLMAIILAISIPLLTYRLLIKPFVNFFTLTPAALCTIGAVSCIILIPIANIVHGNSTLDIHLHDTYFVVPNDYALFVVAIVFILFATTYYWLEKLSKRRLNYTLGYIHFWVTFLIISFVVGSPRYNETATMPRNYFDYSNNFNPISYSNQFTLLSALLLLLTIAQLVFVFNVCYSFFRTVK